MAAVSPEIAGDEPAAPEPEATVSRETAAIPAQAAPEQAGSESTPLAAAVQKQLQLRRGLLHPARRSPGPTAPG